MSVQLPLELDEQADGPDVVALCRIPECAGGCGGEYDGPPVETGDPDDLSPAEGAG